AAPAPPVRRAAAGGEAAGDARLLAIGASTGGTEAIREVLEQLPEDTPGTVIAQHIPAMFSRRFAERLDGCCPMRVCEAEDGQPIRPGHAYVAPGGRHLVVGGGPGKYLCRLTDTPPVHRQRPAVDVLFASVARIAREHAIGVVLTGMGADGADGLLAMRRAGARTIAQDEATSVVWGMPGSAVRAGAAEQVLPLGRIAGAITRGWGGARHPSAA
ncbi:MAG: CheB methylesterase domain-containing protein, partial [Gemmatimonadales bacterium]|nr:CheB methylesterase domain-containing protein [Gemmatimonadales bacterium]